MGRKATPLILEETQRRELRRLAGTPQSLAFRARVILSREEHCDDELAAKAQATSRQTVLLWRRRLEKAGIQGLHDAPCPGHPPVLPAAIAEVAMHIRTKLLVPARN